LQGADDEGGGDVAFDVGDAGHGAAGVDGPVVDADAVLVDLAFLAEAVGEGGSSRAVVPWVFDEHVLDGTGLGMGRDRRAEDGGEAGEDDQKSSAHAALLSGRAGGLPWLGRQDGLETDPLMAASR
jgi:hypothetical protein